MSTVGQRMREVRVSAGVTQIKAAAITDVSERAYKGYEADERDPSLSAVAEFCKYFSLDPAWIMWGDGQFGTFAKTELLVQAAFALVSDQHDRGYSLSPEKFKAVADAIAEGAVLSKRTPEQELEKLRPLFLEEAK